jgi:hypothetical protein
MQQLWEMLELMAEQVATEILVEMVVPMVLRVAPLEVVVPVVAEELGQPVQD